MHHQCTTTTREKKYMYDFFKEKRKRKETTEEKRMKESLISIANQGGSSRGRGQSFVSINIFPGIITAHLREYIGNECCCCCNQTTTTTTTQEEKTKGGSIRARDNNDGDDDERRSSPWLAVKRACSGSRLMMMTITGCVMKNATRWIFKKWRRRRRQCD